MNSELSFQMIEMIAGGVVAQSVSVAAEIGVADLLAHGPRTTAQLATSAGVDAEKRFRLLRFLASRGIFQEDAHGAWSLTPLADLLRSDSPQSMRAGARMFGRMAAVWPKLEANVRTGQCAYQLAGSEGNITLHSQTLPPTSAPCHGADAGVVQRRRGPGFLREAPRAFRIGARVGWQELERDQTVQAKVTRFPHDAHATLAKLVEDLEVRNLAAGGDHGMAVTVARVCPLAPSAVEGDSGPCLTF